MSGKWIKADSLPAAGWRCVFEFAGNNPNQHVCGWCGTPYTGNVFVMEHDAWRGSLDVSEECSNHMRKSPASNRWLTAQQRYGGVRREHWLSRKWSLSKRGNEWIVERAFRVIIYPNDLENWAYMVVHLEPKCSGQKEKYQAQSTFSSSDQAKMAALLFVEELEDKMPPVSDTIVRRTARPHEAA